MSKLLVVFGSTGQQGSSVISHVLSSPSLSSQYTIRAITRDPSKPTALALSARGIQVVPADLDDPSTLPAALSGAHTVFALTTTIYGPPEPSYATELAQGKALADAVVASGAEFLIWSSSSKVRELTGGKLVGASHFDVKAEVQEYISTLPIKAAFYTPGSFMQNFHGHGAFVPKPTGEAGVYAISSILAPDTEIPLVDIAGDTGVFVGAILARPGEYVGKTFSAAAKMYTMREVVGILSRATGKKVVYNQLPVEVFAGFLPEQVRGRIVDMLLWVREYGYYGPGGGEKVEWTVGQVGGPGGVTTLEEYVRRNPMVLA